MTSSAVERFPDKKEAHGPTPWSPTNFFRFEVEREGVDAVAQARFATRPVIEYMSQVRAAIVTKHFRSHHS